MTTGSNSEVNNQFYGWISGASILATGGVWNLWVLHDPDYTPFSAPTTPRSRVVQTSRTCLNDSRTDYLLGGGLRS